MAETTEVETKTKYQISNVMEKRMKVAPEVYGNEEDSSMYYFESLLNKAPSRLFSLPDMNLKKIEKLISFFNWEKCTTPTAETLLDDHKKSNSYKFLMDAKAENKKVRLYAILVQDDGKFDEMLERQLTQGFEQRIIVPPNALLFMYIVKNHFRRLSSRFGVLLTSARAILNDSETENKPILFSKRKWLFRMRKLYAFSKGCITMSSQTKAKKTYMLIMVKQPRPLIN